MSSIVDMTSEAPKINANLDGKLGNPDLEDEVVRRCADNSELRRPSLALKHAARALKDKRNETTMRVGRLKCLTAQNFYALHVRPPSKLSLAS